MYDAAAIRGLVSPAEVLRSHGLESPRRGPCPLCLTSDDSTSFSLKDNRWHCFACGQHGGSIDLEMMLSGQSFGKSVAVLASMCGLAESDPTAMDAARRRRAHERAQREESNEIQAVRWRARLTRRDHLRRVLKSLPETPLGWAAVKNIQAQLEYLEQWIETREYDMKGWNELQDNQGL